MKKEEKMDILIIFIISAIILFILKLPIMEVIIFSIIIALFSRMRVLILFLIISVGLSIQKWEIRTAIIVAGMISLGYWLFLILFTEHKSQTWMYPKYDIETKFEKENRKNVTQTFKDGAINLFGRWKK